METPTEVSAADAGAVKQLAAEVADTLRRDGCAPWLLRESVTNPARFLASQGRFVECKARSDSRGVHRSYALRPEYATARAAALAPERAAAERRAKAEAVRLATQRKPAAQPAPAPAPKPSTPPTLPPEVLAAALDSLETGTHDIYLLARQHGMTRADVAALAVAWRDALPKYEGVPVRLLGRAWAAMQAGDRDEITRLANRTGKGFTGLQRLVMAWRK